LPNGASPDATVISPNRFAAKISLSMIVVVVDDDDDELLFDFSLSMIIVVDDDDDDDDDELLFDFALRSRLEWNAYTQFICSSSSSRIC
jgi:hypothetical protein